MVWSEIWNVPLCCFPSLLGQGGLEVCGHGHWQDIPLDVCAGVYTGICGTLSSSLACWNDLESLHQGKENTDRQKDVFPHSLNKKKVFLFSVFQKDYLSHFSLLGRVIGRLLAKRQDEISIIDFSGHINSLWGQKANSKNILPCHSVLTLSCMAQSDTLVKNGEKLTLTHEELWMMPQTDKDCRHRELFIRLCKVEYIANF